MERTNRTASSPASQVPRGTGRLCSFLGFKEFLQSLSQAGEQKQISLVFVQAGFLSLVVNRQDTLLVVFVFSRA